MTSLRFKNHNPTALPSGDLLTQNGIQWRRQMYSLTNRSSLLILLLRGNIDKTCVSCWYTVFNGYFYVKVCIYNCIRCVPNQQPSPICDVLELALNFTGNRKYFLTLYISFCKLDWYTWFIFKKKWLCMIGTWYWTILELYASKTYQKNLYTIYLCNLIKIVLQHQFCLLIIEKTGNMRRYDNAKFTPFMTKFV